MWDSKEKISLPHGVNFSGDLPTSLYSQKAFSKITYTLVNNDKSLLANLPLLAKCGLDDVIFRTATDTAPRDP